MTNTTSFTPPVADEIASGSAQDAARHLAEIPPEEAALLLSRAEVLRRNEIFALIPGEKLQAIVGAAPEDISEHWRFIQEFPADSLGRLLEPPTAVFSPEVTVTQAVEELRELCKTAFITYAFTTNAEGRLLGVIVMRELLLARPDQTLAEITLLNPFYLTPELELTEAMKLVLNRHYPVYPVCLADGTLVGLIRGSTLFEAQAVELSAQAGSMLGVDKEERLGTPLMRSFWFRHPWLQLNLLTAFIAAAIVGAYSDALEKIVLLAVFLPVMSGQASNTGCQALAVALRGMTLGDLRSGSEKRVAVKEALLGLLNGLIVGVTAAIGIYVFALMQHNTHALGLALILFVAMTISCVISGVAGVLVPLGLRKIGADPATASSILLTSVTDAVSMWLFLGLAAWFLL